MEAFEKTDDSVLSLIKYLSDQPNAHEDLKKAAKILDNLHHRRLYPLICQSSWSPKNNKNGKEASQDIINDKQLKQKVTTKLLKNCILGD